MWAQRVETLKAQKNTLDGIKGMKDLDHIQKEEAKQDRQQTVTHGAEKGTQSRKLQILWCSTGQRQCLVLGKTCIMCSKQNHFRGVCQNMGEGWGQTRSAPKKPRHMHDTIKRESPCTRLI